MKIPSLMILFPPKVRRFALSVGFASLATGSLYSADSTWTGTTNTDWSTSTNWSTGVPSASINAIFNSTVSNQPVLSVNSTALGLWVTGNTSRATTTITGGFQLSITGTGTLNGNSSTGILLDGAGNNSLTITAKSSSNVNLAMGNNTSILVNNSGTLTIGDGTGAINGAGTITFGGTSATGSTVINARIITARAVVIDTAGTVTWNSGPSANLYTLGLTLNNGRLNFNNTSVLGSGGTFTVNGGSIDNTSGAAIVAAGTNAIALNGDLTFVGGGTGTSHDLAQGTSGTAVSVVTLGGSGTRTITTTAANSTLTLNGAISNGTTNGLIKAGAGKLALTNINTYTGATTINAGTLVLSGSGSIGTGNLAMGGGKLDISAIAASSYSLGSSQSLSGNGTITATGKTLTLNGAIDPNTTGLTIDGGTVSLTSTTSFLYALGTSSDSISLTNSAVLSLGAGVIDFSDFTFSTTAGYGVGTYVLIGGASSLTGSLGSNLTGTVGGLNAALGVSGNDLVLTVTSVPEPATWALLGVGGMVGFFFRRRSI